jgi:hypothetical protein
LSFVAYRLVAQSLIVKMENNVLNQMQTEQDETAFSDTAASSSIEDGQHNVLDPPVSGISLTARCRRERFAFQWSQLTCSANCEALLLACRSMSRLKVA